MYDVVCVFPPTTEARSFPYLSLPMITAFLRRAGVKVKQRDLNIELCHKLFTRPAMLQYKEQLEFAKSEDLKILYRLEMIYYLLENQEDLFSRVFEKYNVQKFTMQEAVRFVRHGIELMMEESFLRKEILSLQGIIDAVKDFKTIPVNDIGTQIYNKLVEDIIKNNRPTILAISVPFYSQILPSILASKWVKQISPETHVIIGGQQVMLRYNDLVKMVALEDYIDCLGIGAGEETLLKSFKAVNSKIPREKVPDLIWIKDQTTSDNIPKSNLKLNDLPPPDFFDLPIHNYLNDETNLAIITCIGCYWGRCIFCSYGNRSKKEQNYEQLTAEQIANHCQYIIDTYGIHRINIADENTNLRLITEGMRLLNKRGYKIEFSIRNRLEDSLLDKQFCIELRQLGCIIMSCGYETNSQRLLDNLDKGVLAENYQQIIDNLYEADITLRLSIMGGILDETPDEFSASLEFLRKNFNKIGIDTMQMLIAEPKTFLTENASKFNILIQDSSELRGNSLLNYCLGRVGYKFLYQDGDTFDQRLKQFSQIFHKVNPQKNDELQPIKKHVNKKSLDDELEAHDKSSQFDLFPWIRILESGDSYIVIDLLWQKFYRIPYSVRYNKKENKLFATDHNSSIISSLTRAGIGKPV